MTHVIAVIGWAFCLVCALTALAWLYEVTAAKLWRKCLDSRDFYAVASMYAKQRYHKRANNRVGFTDE